MRMSTINFRGGYSHHQHCDNHSPINVIINKCLNFLFLVQWHTWKHWKKVEYIDPCFRFYHSIAKCHRGHKNKYYLIFLLHFLHARTDTHTHTDRILIKNICFNQSQEKQIENMRHGIIISAGVLFHTLTDAAIRVYYSSRHWMIKYALILQQWHGVAQLITLFMEIVIYRLYN